MFWSSLETHKNFITKSLKEDGLHCNESCVLCFSNLKEILFIRLSIPCLTNSTKTKSISKNTMNFFTYFTTTTSYFFVNFLSSFYCEIFIFLFFCFCFHGFENHSLIVFKSCFKHFLIFNWMVSSYVCKDFFSS